VLRWIIERCAGRAGAVETPIGFLPKASDIDTRGLDVSSATLEQLLTVDNAQWRAEMADLSKYFGGFGKRLPPRLDAEQQKVLAALS
jgi:phosphoenolpyruvate carboxykinase (GTP)